jgi:hypothetical protein
VFVSRFGLDDAADRASDDLLRRDSGDQQADVVTVTGTDRADRVHVSAADGQVDVAGLKVDTRITASETPNTLQLNTVGGNDRVTVDPNVGTQIGVADDLGSGQA